MQAPHKSNVMTYVIIGAVIIGAWFLFSRMQAAPAKPGKPAKPGYSEGFLQSVATSQAAIDTATIQARSQIASQAYSYAAVQNADAAQTRQTQIQGSTAIRLGTIAEDTSEAENLANESIARIFGQTQTQIAGDEESAQNTQSNNNFWGGLFGNIFGFLGKIPGI